MQGTEHQVAGLSGGDRQLNGFQVTHFAHQDHIRIFPQGCPQGIGKTAGVVIELALVHHTLHRSIGEFDRILNRENMFSTVFIDVVENGCQGGGLAGSGWSGHQHQSFRRAADLLHDRGQAQGLHVRNGIAKGAQAGGIGAPLPVHIHPKPGNPLESVGAVQLPGLFQLLALGIVEHREDQLVAGLLVESFLVDRPQLSVEPPIGREPGAEVQVAAAIGNELTHQILDHHGHGSIDAEKGVVPGSWGRVSGW